MVIPRNVYITRHCQAGNQFAHYGQAHSFDLAQLGAPNEQLIDWCVEERVLG
jgi:hypothetical protein